jgi:hypothetical protein
MDNLVKKLSIGKHPVVFEIRTKGIQQIKERLVTLKFVFIKFTNTEGGTELGLHVDNVLTSFDETIFASSAGVIHIVGTCELNYHKVRCIADIELATKKGIGYLEIIS